MATIISWRLQDEKVILSVAGEEGEFDIELPEDIYREILVEGPPSEEKRVKEILDRIYEIKRNRIATIDKILEIDEDLRKRIADMRKEMGDARDELKDAGDKHEIDKWKAVLASYNTESQIIAKEKGITQEYRHLIKLSYAEEAKLRLKLLKQMKEE